jgi:hypothetical protein
MSSEECRMANEGGGQMPARVAASRLSYPTRRDRSRRVDAPGKPSPVDKAPRDAAGDREGCGASLGSKTMIGRKR